MGWALIDAADLRQRFVNEAGSCSVGCERLAPGNYLKAKGWATRFDNHVLSLEVVVVHVALPLVGSPMPRIFDVCETQTCPAQ